MFMLSSVAGIVLCFSCSAGAAPLVTAFDNDGMITVNGKRTLILGSYSAAKSDRPYAELAEAGFNLVHSGADTESLDKAHGAGLMTWVSVGTLDLDKRDASTKTLLDAVNKVKDHPGVAFLETVDEPAWTWNKAEVRVPPQPFVEAYPLIKKTDPNHLLYTNQAPTNLIETLKQYNAGTDIVACDIYPVNPGGLKPMYALFSDGFQGDFSNEQISQVGQYVDKMRAVAGPKRPLIMVLQAFAWEALREKDRDESKVVYPSYAQTRFMAFQALIKGANGILYWGSHTLPAGSQTWTDIKRVVREIADLAQPLAAQRPPQTIAVNQYHEMGYSVDFGVQTLLTEHGGKAYLFTCNADKNPCKATLHGAEGAPGLERWTGAKVLNENRSLPIENGAITDAWQPFEVHIYELAK